MNYWILIIGAMLANFTLIDFDQEFDMETWRVVDDGVMGGLSKGCMHLSDEGNAVFHGTVSLENYGGFSSVRTRMNESVEDYTHFVLTLKGDGKNYQLRAKSDAYESYSYVYTFETSGEWEKVVIPMNEMYPSFRGQKLQMPNYPGETLGEMAILIANKKAETFQLEIDKIELK